WTPTEIKEVLGEEDGAFFCELYDITEKGNYEGKSIPNLIRRDYEMYAASKGENLEAIELRAEACRNQLFTYRQARIRPGKDDKILTSWNGLMIMALSKGYKALGLDEYLQAVKKAADFLNTNLRRN